MTKCRSLHFCLLDHPFFNGVAMFARKDSFFYNLLAVIYVKKFLTRIRISINVYHIVKDVASLITMSSKNHRLTALSQRVAHFKTRRVNTP